MKLFGDDYPTADGTCVRDFVHVTDLAEAHILAADRLAEGGRAISSSISGPAKGAR